MFVNNECKNIKCGLLKYTMQWTQTLVCELIYHWILLFFSLKFTESVFRSEVNHKHDPMTRRLLCQTLNVKPTVSAKVISNTGDCRDLAVAVEKPVPLLYYFVKHFKDARNDWLVLWFMKITIA